MAKVKILHPKNASNRPSRDHFAAFGWAKPGRGKLEILDFKKNGAAVAFTARQQQLRRGRRAFWVVHFALSAAPTPGDTFRLKVKWTGRDGATDDDTATWTTVAPVFGGTVDYPAPGDPICPDYAIAYGTVTGAADPIQGAEMADSASVVTANDFLFNQDGFWCVTFPPLTEDVYTLTVLTSDAAAPTLAPVANLDVSPANCG